MKLTQQVLLPISNFIWKIVYNYVSFKIPAQLDSDYLQKIIFVDNIPFPESIFLKNCIYSWDNRFQNNNFIVQFDLIQDPDMDDESNYFAYNYSPIYRNNPNLKENPRRIIILFNKKKEWNYKKRYDYPIINTRFPTIFIFDSNIGTFMYSNEITERPLNSIAEVNKYSNGELISLAY